MTLTKNAFKSNSSCSIFWVSVSFNSSIYWVMLAISSFKSLIRLNFSLIFHPLTPRITRGSLHTSVCGHTHTHLAASPLSISTVMQRACPQESPRCVFFLPPRPWHPALPPIHDCYQAWHLAHAGCNMLELCYHIAGVVYIYRIWRMSVQAVISSPTQGISFTTQINSKNSSDSVL